METPSGAQYTVEVRPIGIPDVVPFGGAVLEWALGWVWHALRHRGKYRVKVTQIRPLRILVQGAGGAPWATVGSGSRREAEQIAADTARHIEAGDFVLE